MLGLLSSLGFTSSCLQIEETADRINNIVAVIFTVRVPLCSPLPLPPMMRPLPVMVWSGLFYFSCSLDLLLSPSRLSCGHADMLT